VLPSHIKPKPKSNEIIISKLAQEKKQRKLLLESSKNHSNTTTKNNLTSKRELAIPSAITVAQLAQLTHQKLCKILIIIIHVVHDKKKKN
jgi:hypothetical protein